MILKIIDMYAEDWLLSSIGNKSRKDPYTS